MATRGDIVKATVTEGRLAGFPTRGMYLRDNGDGTATLLWFSSTARCKTESVEPVELAEQEHMCPETLAEINELRQLLTQDTWQGHFGDDQKVVVAVDSPEASGKVVLTFTDSHTQTELRVEKPLDEAPYLVRWLDHQREKGVRLSHRIIAALLCFDTMRLRQIYPMY